MLFVVAILVLLTALVATEPTSSVPLEAAE